MDQKRPKACDSGSLRRCARLVGPGCRNGQRGFEFSRPRGSAPVGELQCRNNGKRRRAGILERLFRCGLAITDQQAADGVSRRNLRLLRIPAGRGKAVRCCGRADDDIAAEKQAHYDQFTAVWKTDIDYLHFGSHATSGFDPATGIEESVSNPVVNGHHVYIDKGARSSLRLTYEFGGGFKFNSLSGYSIVKTRADWDANGRNPAPSIFQSGGKFTNYSQEFNIISPDEARIRWVAGFFWQKYLNDIPRWPSPGLNFFTTDAATPTFATPWHKHEIGYAGFGQVAFDLTEGLELQLGARYGHYQFTQFTQWELFPGTLNIPFFDPPGGLTQKYSENDFDWKANLNWEASPTQFFYAVVSRGHTPGSINAGFNAVNVEHTAFKPMSVTNYEAGWKGTFADGHVRTQLAAYYETFKNYQAAFALAVPLGGPVDSVAEFKNAQTTSKTYGMEFSLQARFGDLAFDGGLALFHSKLGSFGAVINPFNAVYGGGPTVVLSGAKTTFSPEVTANAGIEYTFHAGESDDSATITPRVDIAYRGDSYSYLWQNRSTLLPAVTLLNAQIRFEKGPWWVTLWATNLTDRRYPGAKQNVGVGAADAFFPAPHIIGIVYAAPPRLVGVRVGHKW